MFKRKECKLMFDSMRNNSKIIVYIVVAVFIITGGLMGFGAYMNNNQSSSANNSSPYIAKVNDENITQKEFFNVLRNQANQYSQLDSSQVLSFRLNVLNSMIERRLILQKAEEKGLKPQVTDKDVQDTINQILEQNEMEKKDLVSNLEKQGTTFDKFKQSLRESLKANDVLQQTIKTTYNNIKVSEKEIKESYKKQNDVEKASGEQYEKAKSDIKSKLLNQKQQKAFNNWLENVKGNADIAIFDPALKGLNALKSKNYEVAVSSLQKALETNSSSNLYIYLAQAYRKNKQQDKAIATYDTAIKEYPENWRIYSNYGNLFNEMDKKEKAIKYYDKASELAGDDFMAHYQLYMAYSQLDAKDKAQKEMDLIKDLQKKKVQQQKELQQKDQQEQSKAAESTGTKENSKESAGKE